ncbi:MAG TPA: glycosyltransferase family A protein [Burkholderiales bacterium]|nr:glycosyltransferase family A protein [Burkholderiales bacterium]
MNEQRDISVIIPVWNDADRLARCLRSLEAQTFPRERIEVLVVDNGSSDASAQVARGFAFVTVLEESRPGSYCARNRALDIARGEFVAFTDSDCEAAPDWLASGFARAQREDDFGVIAGRIDLFAENGDSDGPAAVYERLFAFDQSRNVGVGFCVTANWISRRALVLAHGGFANHLKSGGDRELSSAIRAAGHRLVYAPEVVVKHPIRSDAKYQFAKKRRVIGGAWSGSRNAAPVRFLRLQAAQFLEALSRAKRIALQPSLTIGTRIRTIGFVLALWAVTATEITRLLFGGEPRRA